MKVDFQIVGGGLLGLSSAYALQKRGASVRVIEAREGVGLETSFANAGMLHASVAAPWNHPGVGWELLTSFFDPQSAMKLRFSQLPSMANWGIKFLKASRAKPHWYATEKNFELAVKSMEINDLWRTALAMDIDHCRNGLMNIMRDHKQFDHAKAMAAKFEALGFEAETLDPESIVKKEPALGAIADQIVGAVYYPGDYSADAYKFCRALKTQLVKDGGEIVLNSHVTKVLEQDGCVTGAICGEQDYRADVTIIAAGAYSAKLVRSLGVKLSMRPVKGYSLTFDGLEKAGNAAPMMPVVDEGLHAAMTPLGDRLRIAGTAEITGFNKALPKARLETLLGMVKSVYPDFAKGLSVDQGRPWCGFRPVSADGIPFIGRTSIPGLAVNTGHGHMGWTLAAGSGELLADILDGQAIDRDALAYSPVRV